MAAEMRCAQYGTNDEADHDSYSVRSFVFGQPIFMELGGVLPNCSVHGAPAYSSTCDNCVFNSIEHGYAEAVGRLWTQFAASGDPNRADEGGEEEEWPRIEPNARAKGTRNVVLRPDGGAAGWQGAAHEQRGGDGTARGV